MERLATLGVVIVFLGTLGKFLDKHHFEESTIERIRVKLIGFFIFLYELPDNLRMPRQAAQGARVRFANR